MDTPTKPWHLYIIECNDGSLYTGITTDVERRFLEHRGMGTKGVGAKFFRARVPRAVRYTETYPDRSSASRREMEVKRMSAAEKKSLIQGI